MEVSTRPEKDQAQNWQHSELPVTGNLGPTLIHLYILHSLTLPVQWDGSFDTTGERSGAELAALRTTAARKKGSALKGVVASVIAGP
ncbi:jg10162 [Pararge aegeria aegeria]|uniref:Jg10162 protein n=1 Tax=Pararge aegeria aegeria TaxID=348720 RepID=A0A8S4RB18_9NEOP|nr:jg10162 [Pararge aegeria aegeria]